jgi:large subunit ribosomal protein L2
MLLKKTNFRLYKRLLRGKTSIAGITTNGRKTLYHRGSGVKRKLRLLDFSKYVCSIPALVLSVEYDPTRTALISLAAYANGAVTYTLAVNGVAPGALISTLIKKNVSPGIADSSFLNLLKPGIYLSSVEVRAGRGATYVRAGGAFAKLVSLAKRENFLF